MTTPGINELATDVNKPLSLSNKLLAQAEGVGLTFYTLNFARLVCADVHISSEGQRTFNSCLSNLPRWACLDEKLQFGFGDRHMFRNPDINLYEYEHLLLAAALGEYFSENYTAAIFSAIGDYFETDDRPKPQLASFKRFVNGTNGILSATKFPLLVDDRIRVNPYRDHDGGRPHATTTTEFIPIDRVANAIRMLGKLKAGEFKEITFIGGDIIGWFSAFVEVFLGISQSLKDGDGNILYQNNGHSNCVNLTYAPPESSQTEEGPNIIWLRKPINTAKRSDAIPPIMTGRVIGDAMFSKVFGTAFHILDQTEAKAFGNALGGLARSWELWKDSADAPPGFISDENRSDTGSWGAGLIETWTNWFPELRHLQGRMERALKLNIKDSGRMCEESILRLEPLCGCYICSPTKGTDENPTNLPKHDFCLPTMMETIITLGLSLSRVFLVPGLFPSRAGILVMYKAQVQRRLSLKTIKTEGFDRFQILFGNDWNSGVNHRLQSAITLFSGSKPTTDLPDNLLAISHEGMCAYVLKLQRGDHAAARSDDNVIRVLMGHINWRQKTYNRLTLGCVQPPVEIGAGWESLKCEHFKERIYVK